jgi:hypothetical protein
MRTITKTHQACGKSMILNPSVRIESVRTNSRGRRIGVDSSNVDREQRAGRYAFRSSVVVQKQVLFGPAIKHALALLPGVPAHFVAIQESHLQIRASKEMPSRSHDQLAGGGDARHPVGDTLRKNLAVAAALIDQMRPHCGSRPAPRAVHVRFARVAPDSRRAADAIVTVKVRFATSQPPGEASNSRLCRPARESV